MTLDLLRSLLKRALYDIERGWPAAALDALGRALKLIESSVDNPPSPMGIVGSHKTLATGT